jgi:protease PrsW
MELETGRALSWWRVFFAGLGLWVASVVVTGMTHNFNLIPTVVLLGSFLVPVTAVLWYLDHYHSPVLTGRDVLNGFLVGGVLGVLGASVLESWLLTGGPLLYFIVGLVEEGAKLLALLAVTWRLPHRTARDGVVMGAAVGFGFAALESSGYALTALFASAPHLSLSALVQTELLRGVLAPFGHGLWTAILGGVLFAAARDGRFRLTRGVVLTYLGVSLLHAFWDSMRGVAMLLTVLLTGTPINLVQTPTGTVLAMTDQQAQVFTEAEIGGYAVVSLIGILWLVVLWRRRRPVLEPSGRRELA